MQNNSSDVKVKLKELIEIKHGYAFKGQYFKNYETTKIVVTPGNFAIGGGFQLKKPKYYEGPVPSGFVLQPGDLIVTMTDLSKTGDTLGYSALIPADQNTYLHNQRIGLIRMKSEQILKDYLYYLMRTREYQKYVVSTSSGATVRHTSPERILQYAVHLPSLAVQERAASLLKKYDELITTNENTILLLKKASLEIYREWFVRLRFPQMNYPPVDEWESSPIGEVVEVLGGGTPSKADRSLWSDGDINWYTPSDLTSSSAIFRWSSNIKTNSKGIASGSAKIFPPYSVMMTSRATLGVIGINTTPASTNQGFIICVPNNKVPLWYLYHWMLTNSEVFESQASGSTFKEITRSVFRKNLISLPPVNLLQLFEKTVTPMWKQVELFEKTNKKLKDDQALLLPKLMAGEL